MTNPRLRTRTRGGREQERHAELLAQLESVKQQQRDLRRETDQFLREPAAHEKADALRALRELRSRTPDVTVLCAQTGAVVERIASANEAAEKMTEEVRRIDIVQSRLTATLAQSEHLLSLRNSLVGIRRAMQLHNYPEAATYLKKLKEIETIMPLDVADKLRVDTIESDLKGIIESAFDEGLRDNDRPKVNMYAPLFQIVGVEYEERGFEQLRRHLSDTLTEQIAPMTRGSFSTKELLDHLTTLFNQIAAVAQEYDQLVNTCFSRVLGVNRLIQEIYAIGEEASVTILTAYMLQRKFHERMSEQHERVESPRSVVTTPSSSSMSRATTPSVAAAEDEIAVLNEQLNEVALLIQHTQTYERFMRSRVATDEAPISDDDTAPKSGGVLPSSSESELGKTVQELAGYYCFFENDLLNKAARKAFQWEELRYSSAAAGGTASAGEVVTFPISSAVDEILYVSRNSGLRGLATGHADCAAGVLNMVNTVLRDALGDTMRSRIRNMAAHTKLDGDSGLLAASSQLRDQVQQKFAQLSKTMGPIQISTGVAAAVGVGMSGVGTTAGGAGGSGVAALELRKELSPDVVMNSLEATVEYVGQLKREFENELRQDFQDVPSHLQTCLNALEDASAELSQLLLASRKKLCKVLEPKLVASLGALLATNAKRAVTYELSDQMFTFNEANDPFAHQFAAAMRDVTAALRPSLSPSNCRMLLEALAQCAAELVERWFHARHVRFNQLGALQFDKDVRVLSGAFADEGRAAFAPLAQIAMVLNVDAPADVLDFFGRARRGVEWTLSAAQVKEVLSRRVEFSDSAINKLKL